MRFFDPDSAATRFLTRLFDLILLNALFLVTSLPLVTAGASLTALYTMTLGMLAGTEGPILRGYFRAFRENFRAATLLWLPFLLLLAFFGADLYIIHRILPPALRWLQFPVWILLFPVCSVLLYAFPLLARYRNSLRQTAVNAVLLSLANVPTTIFLLVILTALTALSLSSVVFRVTLFSLLLFFGCSLLALFFSLFFARIFEKAAS